MALARAVDARGPFSRQRWAEHGGLRVARLRTARRSKEQQVEQGIVGQVGFGKAR